MYYSPLRYPGGKGKVLSYMKELIKQNNLCDSEYVEPYAGGAGVALGLLLESLVSKIYINDADEAINALWESLINDSENFIKKVEKTKITIEEWNKQRKIYSNPNKYSLFELGFAAFFLNRCNRSGILNGRMIGGYEQKGKWKIDVRFNKKDLINRIEKIANFRSRIVIYKQDTYQLLVEKESQFKNAILYLDPPYYEKSDQLYRNTYRHSDHEKIAQLMKKIDGYWIVSYDNVEPITELYSFSRSRDFEIAYSAGEKRRGREVMFFSDKLIIPERAIC